MDLWIRSTRHILSLCFAIKTVSFGQNCKEHNPWSVVSLQFRVTPIGHKCNCPMSINQSFWDQVTFQFYLRYYTLIGWTVALIMSSPRLLEYFCSYSHLMWVGSGVSTHGERATEPEGRLRQLRPKSRLHLHSWQKAASLLMQHLKNPPSFAHFFANFCFPHFLQSSAQTLASREELRMWHVL